MHEGEALAFALLLTACGDASSDELIGNDPSVEPSAQENPQDGNAQEPANQGPSVQMLELPAGRLTATPTRRMSTARSSWAAAPTTSGSEAPSG